MTEGTKSYLLGCHQFIIHPLYVTLAWKKIYKRWPRLWELVCIFLHDVGHLGRQYLSNYEEKRCHWILGADTAYKLFGDKGFYLVAGHTTQSGVKRSMLFWADKYSWVICPNWWLTTNRMVEDFGTVTSKPENWKRAVAAEIVADCPNGCHGIYLAEKETSVLLR